MELDAKQRKALKAQAHHLKAVIQVGQHGISEGLIAETDAALTHHELIKVHIASNDREERKLMAEQLSEKCQACLLHKIGKVFILYRQNPEDKT